MAKLDFNALAGPVLELTMMDEGKTSILVDVPTEGLIEKMEGMIPHLATLFDPDKPESIGAAYDLAARLISCNKLGLQVSAADLREKYWRTHPVLNQLDLMAFFKAYLEFIEEIKNAKN